MSFDGSGFDWQAPTPEPRRPHPAQEKVLTALVIWLVVMLFLLPVSAGTLVDVAHYLLR